MAMTPNQRVLLEVIGDSVGDTERRLLDALEQMRTRLVAEMEQRIAAAERGLRVEFLEARLKELESNPTARKAHAKRKSS